LKVKLVSLGYNTLFSGVFLLNDLWFVFYHKMTCFKKQHMCIKVLHKIEQNCHRIVQDGEICFWRGSKSNISLLFIVEK
jgi:hypothetical protein